MARYSLIPWGLSDIVILVTITTEMIDDVSDNDDDDDDDDGNGGDVGYNGDAANGDKPEVSPKECIDRQAGTFAQDIPASHVYSTLDVGVTFEVVVHVAVQHSQLCGVLAK